MVLKVQLIASVEVAALVVTPDATATKTFGAAGAKKYLVFCDAAVPRIGIGLLRFYKNK
jgi:hypothetical protein